MCSKPVVNTVARVASGVVTAGASEIARAVAPKSVVSQVLNTPGEIATAGMGSSGGLIDATKSALAPKMPEVPQATPPQEEAAPEPGASPGVTGVEGILARRRRKLSALQSGLLSTIATSPTGLAGGASVLTPAAGGLKDKLGV